jgi:hypothetical protein
MNNYKFYNKKKEHFTQSVNSNGGNNSSLSNFSSVLYLICVVFTFYLGTIELKNMISKLFGYS